MAQFKKYDEIHSDGIIEVSNLEVILQKENCINRGLDAKAPGLLSNFTIDGDLGIQIAHDGRVWLCIDGVAFLRFKPSKIPFSLSVAVSMGKPMVS